MRLDFSIFFSKFNKMEDGNLAILVDAKTEYTKQLVSIIAPYIYSGVKKIYIEAKEESFERDEMENTLRTFQKRLSDIPKWNQEVIDEEYTNIISDSKCDWLEDLIMAVFVSHTRILTSINFNKNKNKVNLKIPKVDHFIHQCYIEVARCFWKNPYLFDDTINKYEFQRNRREAEQLIERQIHETIRRQLPVKNILREYLGNDYREVEEPEDDIESDSNYQDNLRKLVKAEIENCSKEKLEQFSIDEDVKPDEDCTLEDNSNSNSSEIEEILENVPVELKEESIPSEPAVQESESNTQIEEIKSSSPVENASAVSLTKNENESSVEELVKDISNMDDAELSDNEIEKNEVAEIIEKEVEKLDMESLDNGLQVEELNLDLDDLSLLEEVYQDDIRPVSPVQAQLPVVHTLSNNSESNLTLDESNKVETLLEPSHEENIKVKIEEPPIKTIIIDTKKGGKIISENDDLEINDYDEGSDSEDESSKVKQKVYNKYSKNRDYSFFNN